MGYLTHGTEAGGNTYDLLFCPFCGGDAKEFTGKDAAPHRWTVECDSCGAHVGSDTRHKARAKWNRRAERTCHYIYDKEICAWRCSECGGLEPVGDHVRYCPDCGARIAEEVKE